MNSQNKTLSKHWFLNNIFDSLKKISLDIKNRTFINEKENLIQHIERVARRGY